MAVYMKIHYNGIITHFTVCGVSDLIRTLLSMVESIDWKLKNNINKYYATKKRNNQQNNKNVRIDSKKG